MATDGFYIYINPDFSKKLSEEHLKGVLAHELLHNLWDTISDRVVGVGTFGTGQLITLRICC